MKTENQNNGLSPNESGSENNLNHSKEPIQLVTYADSKEEHSDAIQLVTRDDSKEEHSDSAQTDTMTQDNSSDHLDDDKIPASPPILIAKFFLTFYTIIRIFHEIFIYDEVKGIYLRMNDDPSGIIRQYISYELYNLCKPKNEKDALIWLDTWIPESIEIIEHVHLVNFMDAVYDLSTGKIIEHNSEYYFFYGIPVNICECPPIGDMQFPTPVFDSFIENISKGDERLKCLIYQVMAYAIANCRSMKCIFFLYGPSNTGKSVFIELLRSMLGRRQCSSIPLRSLKGEYRTSGLKNSRLNAFGETDILNDKDLPLLKALTGGDYINANVKYQQPVEFQNKAMLLFSTNRVDSFEDITPGDAFWQRMVIIPFENSLPVDRQDPNLLDKLKAEIPGILSKYVLPALQQLYMNGWKLYNQKYIADVRNRCMRQQSTVCDFVENVCILDANASISRPLLYDCYICYCTGIGANPLGRQTFYERLETFFPAVSTKRERIEDNSNPQYVFTGITALDKLIEKVKK